VGTQAFATARCRRVALRQPSPIPTAIIPLLAAPCPCRDQLGTAEKLAGSSLHESRSDPPSINSLGCARNWKSR
jgi:hypothetical protein